MYISDLIKYQQEGNGVILKLGKQFIFAVGNEKYWDKSKKPWIITYTNTGGHVESGETREEATRREVKEELGCDIEIISSKQTLYCDLEDPHLITYNLDDDLTPILIYNSQTIEMSVCVYLARIPSTPFPHQEVPAILLLPENLLQGGILLDLLENGCTIQEQTQGNIPRNAVMKPFGSAKLLVDYWDVFMDLSCFQSFNS